MNTKIKSILNKILKEKALVAFIVIFILASILYPRFLTPKNITNVLRQVSMKGLVAVGMTFVILTGGIDLSVGSIIAFSGVVAAYLSDHSLLLVISVTVLAGCCLGLINGLIITRMRIIPFVATLSTMMGIRGAAYIATNVQSITISKDADSLAALGRGYLLGVPIPAIIFIIAVGLAIFISRKTSFGRGVYAVGGNEKAAKMMGLKNNQIKTICYVISGGLTALAGVILTGRLGAGQAVGGEGWEMTVIAAVAIGGTHFSGGKGKFSGTFAGILLLGIITNIINLQGNVSSWWQKIITGFLLLAVVIIQAQFQERKSRNEFVRE